MLLDYFVYFLQLMDCSFEKLVGKFPHLLRMLVHLPERAQNFILRMFSNIQFIQHLKRAFARYSPKSHNLIRRDICKTSSWLQLLHKFNHFDCGNRSVKPFIARFETGPIYGLFHRVACQDSVDHRNPGLQTDGAQFFGDS